MESVVPTAEYKFYYYMLHLGYIHLNRVSIKINQYHFNNCLVLTSFIYRYLTSLYTSKSQLLRTLMRTIAFANVPFITILKTIPSTFSRLAFITQVFHRAFS